MLGWYKYCFVNYSNFNGRATRAEFWVFTLINAVILTILSKMTDIALESGNVAFPIAFLGAAIIIFLPSLAVAVRRLHDRGHTGWWAILYVVPALNLVLLPFFLLPSMPGPNMYGESAPQSPNENSAH